MADGAEVRPEADGDSNIETAADPAADPSEPAAKPEGNVQDAGSEDNDEAGIEQTEAEGAETTADVDVSATVDTTTEAEDGTEPTTDKPEPMEDGLLLQARGRTSTLAAPQTKNATSGQCGDDAYWKLENEVLTISGTGAIWDAPESAFMPWIDWIVEDEDRTDDTPTSQTNSALRFSKAVIENGITYIPDYAFSYCDYVEEVILPSSVTSMGWSVFDACPYLTSAGPIGGDYNIQFGWATAIPKDAFSRSNHLQSVTIPVAITRIDASAFYGCDALTDVYFDGAREQAEKISIGSDNEALLNATWHYSDAEASTGGDWSDAYRSFVLNRKYLQIDQQIYSNNADDPIIFALHDLDADGTSELILYNGADNMADALDYVFSYQNGIVKYMGHVGFRECGLYSYADKKYPGLFCHDGNMGEYRTEYYSLKKGTIRSETVLKQELTDGEQLKTTQVTADDALYALVTEGKAIALEQFSEAEIRAMGWDAFVAKYALSVGSGREFEGVLMEEDGLKIRWKVAYAEKEDGTKTDTELEIWIDGEAKTYSGSVGIYDPTGKDMTPWLTKTGFAKTDFVKITLRGGKKNVMSTLHHQFMGYSNVKTVTISHIDLLDTGVFQDCSALTLVEGLDSDLKSIAPSAFKNCAHLTTVNGSENATNLFNIGAEAFMDTALLGFAFSDSVKTIGDRAFYSSKLYAATLGKNVEEIGEDAFITDAFSTGHYLTIYCYLDSLAYQYAKKNKIPYKILDGDIDIDIEFGKYTGHFSNQYFSSSSTNPNNELAKFAGLLSTGVYHDADKPSIRDIYHTLGIPEDNWVDNAVNRSRQLSFSIAEKTIYINEEEYLLLMITARGTITEQLRDHFTRADTPFGQYMSYGLIDEFRRNIWGELNAFVETHPEIAAAKLKVLITGHSLGGAAANLLGAEFNMKVKGGGWYNLTRKEDIYVYTFGALDSIDRKAEGITVQEGYENIHNIYNFHDSFGPKGWPIFTAAGNSGYGKFGHIDLFYTDRDKGKFGAQENHSIYNTYLEAVFGGKVFYAEGQILTIHCPVDVRVYEGETLVCEIVNETINYTVTTLPTIVYEMEKVIGLMDGHAYRIEITARESGEMKYAIINSSTGRVKKSFEEIKLAPKKLFLSEVGNGISISDVKLYVLNDDGEPIREVHQDGTETEIVPPSGTIYFLAEGDPVNGWVEVDGVPYEVVNGTVTIPADLKASVITQYTYNMVDEDPHKIYPTGMKVWFVETVNGVTTAKRSADFDDILQYAGSSIRYTGKKGIRMITAIPRDKRNKLISKQLAGYTLVEYGTVVGWDNELAGEALVLNGKAARQAYAYKRGVADPIFKTTSKTVQYTNVLVGLTNEKCIPDLSMRPYMIVRNAAGDKFIIYGGTIHRSIGYIAYQNRDAFRHGASGYRFIWDIIHYVYGTKYDAEYWR